MMGVDDRPVLLFVDDEERIIRLLKMTFRTQYKVFTALNAEEALETLEANRIDVIVCDQRMPGTTGIELLAQVRSKWPEVVRILLTGYSDLVAIIGSVNQGEVHRFLSKPWDQAGIRETISEAIELAESLRQTLDAIGAIWDGAATGPQFSLSSQVLVIDETDSDRQSIADMLSDNYQVLLAATLDEAIQQLTTEEVGVIVTATEVEGTDVTDLLAEIANLDPAITIMATNSIPHSETVIRLINTGRIFRFAIKPLNPALVHSAVSDCMREHHHRLADPRIVKRRMRTGAFAKKIDDEGGHLSFAASLRARIQRA